MSSSPTRRSALILWLCAPVLLGLGLYRPFTPSSGRADQLPTTVGEWQLHTEHPLTVQDYAMLGTDDAVWRTYTDSEEVPIYLTAVFHDSNWKSVHPPHICLQGSNMEIVRDDSEEIPLADGPQEVGRLLCQSLDERGEYLSLYAYGSRDFTTSSYWSFFFHHLPRAVVRSSNSGFLLRVETWLGEGGEEAAQRRCADFLAELLPAARALLR